MVEATLIESPITRNDDALLLLSIWSKYYGVKPFFGTITIQLNEFFKLPNKDDVKRIRAKFNQMGFYLSDSPEVIKRRQRGVKWYRKFLQYA